MEASNTTLDAVRLSGADRCLRLFLSVDVSGSTDFKNRRSKPKDYELYWPRFYESFFDDFPALFANKVGAQFPDGTRPCPEVWKCLGDEIIYETKVSGREECHKLVHAFYGSILEYDETLRTGEKYKMLGLRVKGTCWTAGFPIRNIKLDLPGPGNKTYADYIGLDLDIGFRLSKTSRPGRVVISMDLADILTRPNTFQPPLTFYHVGWEVLKGVFADKPYPVIWIKGEGGVGHILPWEEHLCPFTEKFQKNAVIDVETLQKKIAQIRDGIPELELIVPYFTAADMPQSHKDIWQDWEKRFERDRNQDVGMDSGDEGTHAIAPGLM